MANKSGPGSRRVRDIMTANPACVTEKDSILEAARLMKREDAGAIPVVDGKKVVGIITDRDIVVRLVAEGKNLNDCKVNEAMTKHIRVVREDDSVNDVLEVMKSANIRRVPVCDDNDQIVGIVAMADLAIEGNEKGKVGDVVQDISEARPNN